MRAPLPLAVGLALLAVVPQASSGAASGAALHVAVGGATVGPCTRTSPCTWKAAFRRARPGALILVQPGSYPADDTSRNSITIFGERTPSRKPVTFACADPDSTVTFSARWFTIKAFHVRIVGGCFRFHALRFGEPGESGVTTSDVLVQGAQMEGFEIVGADRVTLRGVEVGPNVACWEQSSPVPASMKCDRDGPPYEAFYAVTGNRDLPLQPYIHNNGGGQNPRRVVIEDSWFHDIQTKDAARLHTGCGLIWLRPGSPRDNLIIRRNRFENCAVLGLLFDHADGVTIEGNTFGYPTEPLSNGLGDDVEADQAQREVVLKTVPDWTPRNWLIRRNSFSHGISIDPGLVRPPFENFRVVENVLGNYTYCVAGAVFLDNLFRGPVCGERVARLPYGYRLRDNMLEIDEQRGAAVRAAFRLAAAGTRPVAIAKALGREGLPRRTPAQILAILDEPLYLGRRFGVPGTHPPLVDRATWRQTQRNLAALTPRERDRTGRPARG